MIYNVVAAVTLIALAIGSVPVLRLNHAGIAVVEEYGVPARFSVREVLSYE